MAAGQATFTIQSAGNLTLEEPEIIAAQKISKRWRGPGVTLIGEALTPEQYRGLLHSGDLALLPYDRQAYRAQAGDPGGSPRSRDSRNRAGGNLVGPAVACGRAGSTPVGLTYEDVGEVPQLLREMVRHHAAYRDAARALAPRWMERHNAARLIEILAADGS